MAKRWVVATAMGAALLLSGCADVPPAGGSSSAPTRKSPIPTPTQTPTFDPTQAAVTQNWGPPLEGDEFNSGTAPDPARWEIYNSPGNAGKGLRVPSAVTIANGALTISGDANGTTGGVAAKFARQKYGRWEARMKTSVRDPKYRPVVMLWPDSNASPTCAEVDYGEASNATASVSFFLHYACSGTSFQTYANRPLDTTQWHNYAVDWSPSAIIGYIDGVEWFRDTVHVPTESMHQALQLDWFPDGTPTVPTKMYVDWVRVYAPAGMTTSSPAPRG